MYSLFIVLLSFHESLAHNQTKSLFLNDKLCIVKPIMIMLKYYPFMISSNKCMRSWNVSSPKTFFPKETKDKCESF